MDKRFVAYLLLIIVVAEVLLFLEIDRRKIESDLRVGKIFEVVEKGKYSKTLIDFVEIDDNEYYAFREGHYTERKLEEPTTESLENVKREEECFVFYDKNDYKSDLKLCDYIPSENEREADVVKYSIPIYLDELKGYYIQKNYYEGGKKYLLDSYYPNRLAETFGFPIISPDKKYFFTIGSENGYVGPSGLDVWEIVNYQDETGFWRIASYNPRFFNAGTGVSEAFWVDNKIYLKLDSDEFSHGPAYVKAVMREFEPYRP
jgi:hypothetical protein